MNPTQAYDLSTITEVNRLNLSLARRRQELILYDATYDSRSIRIRVRDMPQDGMQVLHNMWR